MGKGFFSDFLSDFVTELPSIIGIAGLQSTLSGATPRTPDSKTATDATEKEKEVSTTPFSREDEAVFSQLERLLEREDFDTLSRLFDVLEPHQADDFRYYVVKQNQMHERVVKSRKAVRTGASQKGPEKDEVSEEFDFSLTANLYGPEDVRVKYLAFVAGKIRELDRRADIATGRPGVNGAEEVKRLLIKRRLIGEKSVQQKAAEAAGKAGDTLKNGTRQAYRFLLVKKLGGEYPRLLGNFLRKNVDLTEDDAWERRDFVIDILAKRAKELGETEPKETAPEATSFRGCVARGLQRLTDRVSKK